MEIVHTEDAGKLAELQKKDSAIAQLKAREAEVPLKIKALNDAFEKKKASMSAAHEALMALQSKKKEMEIGIAEADEGIRKHQRELNLVKDNNAFKALLSEIEHDKEAKDALETEVLVLLDEIDRALVQDKAIQAEVKGIESSKDAEVAGLEAAAADIAAKLSAAAEQRAAAAGAIDPDLMEKYEAIRAARGGLAVAAVHEEPATGKLTCSGCHMSLTPQKAVDIKKPNAFAVCAECRRFMYLEKTILG